MRTRNIQNRPTRTLVALVAFGLALSLAGPARAQGSHGSVAGVANFGRVTDRYFRGGKVTPEGIKNLYDMGVRTVVDLAGKGGEEEATCKRLGIAWYSFPMNGSETPDDATVAEILSIIQKANEPVYVHCSAGKHRAGTICALYRTRVQGWPADKAWEEQQSYGFGPAEGHPELYAYVYRSGNDAVASNASAASEDHEILTRSGGQDRDTITHVEKASKAKKHDDDSDDRDSDGHKHASKKHDSGKSKKHDDDH